MTKTKKVVLIDEKGGLRVSFAIETNDELELVNEAAIWKGSRQHQTLCDEWRNGSPPGSHALHA